MALPFSSIASFQAVCGLRGQLKRVGGSWLRTRWNLLAGFTWFSAEPIDQELVVDIDFCALKASRLGNILIEAALPLVQARLYPVRWYTPQTHALSRFASGRDGVD